MRFTWDGFKQINGPIGATIDDASKTVLSSCVQWACDNRRKMMCDDVSRVCVLVTVGCNFFYGLYISFNEHNFKLYGFRR